MAFSKPVIGQRGYDPHEVDAFLERAAKQLKRTNSPFRQQLKPDVGSQPGFPAAPGGFRGHTGKRSKPRRFEMSIVFLAIVGAAFSLVAFGIGVYDVYGYRVGTPTTAKVVSCSGSGSGSKHSGRTCMGTWSVGGKSYAGRIQGDGKGYQVGSSLDVHGGSAYTVTSGKSKLPCRRRVGFQPSG